MAPNFFRVYILNRDYYRNQKPEFYYNRNEVTILAYLPTDGLVIVCRKQSNQSSGNHWEILQEIWLNSSVKQTPMPATVSSSVAPLGYNSVLVIY